MATPVEVLVPDIGGFKDVSVIDVLVKDGQQVDKEMPLITIETEKAAMDVPAPAAGKISSVKVKQGDKVSEGSLILLLESSAADAPVAGAGEDGKLPGETKAVAPPAAPEAKAQASSAARPPAAAEELPAAPPRPATPAPAASKPAPAAARSAPAAPAVSASAAIDEVAFSKAYASPSVRKFARELGADLGRITGTGPKARITEYDVKAHVKKMLQASAGSQKATGSGSSGSGLGSGLPKVPEVDFSKFGEIELQPLSRIQKISGARLQASWVNLPHVTQHDEADITDLETARAALKGRSSEDGVKLTPLAFIIKACVLALQKFPTFNSSLDVTGENLVLKKYFNIGFAADTPSGLVVPVIPDADRRSIYEIARALGDLSAKARAGKLKATDMQGGTFTVSSLGGIGGTAFTPIINAPEVAILGVSKSSYKPVFENGAFVPRLMLPLSLSYDHRVIDGAAAARFVVFLSKSLSDPKVLI